MGRRQCGVDSRTRSILDAKTLKIAPRCCARGCKWTRNILMAFPPSSLPCVTRPHLFCSLCKLWHVSERAGPVDVLGLPAMAPSRTGIGRGPSREPSPQFPAHAISRTLSC